MNTAIEHLLATPLRLKDQSDQIKVYALVVGIDNYQEDIPALSGCLKDVDLVADFLQERYGDRLVLRTLKDEEATYENVIAAFREHLVKGEGGVDDTYWFHFSGHGSEQFTAPEFFQPKNAEGELLPSLASNGKDQTLVCFNGEAAGDNIFLADKELAVLIHELHVEVNTGDRIPHVLISLDCCHSGTGTRGEGELVRQYQFLRNEVDRDSDENPERSSRTLDSYLAGWYKQESGEDQSKLFIPAARHVLMSACNNLQLAGDTLEGGVFTSSLIDAFRATKGEAVNYVDLFNWTRARAKAKRKKQTPQLELINNFDPYTAVLEGWRLGGPGRYEIRGKNEKWYVGAGAIHGLPIGESEKVQFLIYEQPGDNLLGVGEIKSVGIKSCRLKDLKKTTLNSEGGIEFTQDTLELETGKNYIAEIYALPAPMQHVLLEGEAAKVQELKEAWDKKQESTDINLKNLEIHPLRTLDPDLEATIGIEVEKGEAEDGSRPVFRIKNLERNRLWSEIGPDVENPIPLVKRGVDKVVRWKRMLNLESPASDLSAYYELQLLSTDYVAFQASGKPHPIEERGAFLEIMRQHDVKAGPIELKFQAEQFFRPEEGVDYDKIPFLFRIKTLVSGKKLYFYLYDLLEDCAIRLHEGGEKFIENTIEGQLSDFGSDLSAFQVHPNEGEAHFWFKLFVTTSPIDASALTQSGFSSDKGETGIPSSGASTWHCETIKVTLKRDGVWQRTNITTIEGKGIGRIGTQFGQSYFYKAKNYLLAIAVNKYDDHPNIPNLNNCINDVQDLVTLLTEDFEFESENVRLLTSGELDGRFEDMRKGPATEEFIFRELRAIGQEIKKEAGSSMKTNLILYYSGHGIYDDFLDQGYWIPADAELDDYSKYISNSTIRDFLNSIRTHHTFLISDSCFSGSLFAISDGRSIGSSRLEKDASRWGLTAGRNEVVSDGAAGTNSPFATSLIEVLQGNKTIGVQKLCSLVLEKVAAGESQTPRGEPLRVRGHEGGQFIFRKKESAEKHFEAGQTLMELAEYRPEYERFRSAANQFALARRLEKNKVKRAKYALREAEALSAAGDGFAAIRVLKTTLSGLDENKKLRYILRSKLAILRFMNSENLPQKKREEVAAIDLSELLQEILDLEPEIVEETGLSLLDLRPTFLSEIMDRYKPVEHPRYSFLPLGGSIILVLVGIDKYPELRITLNGCVNDVNLMAATFNDLLGTEFTKIKMLTDEEATYDNILQTLDDIREELKPEDTLIIHCSAYAVHNSGTAEEQQLLYCYDSKVENDRVINVMTCEAMHQAITTIERSTKVLSLDVCGNDRMVELAKKGDYTLLMGATGKETAVETTKAGKRYGAFSWALATAFQSKPDKIDDLRLLVKRYMSENNVRNQTPAFFSDVEGRLSFHALEKAATFLYGAEKHYPQQELRQLLRLFVDTEVHLAPIDILHCGRRFSRLGDYQSAASLYKKVSKDKTIDFNEIAEKLSSIGKESWKAHFDVVKTYLKVGDVDSSIFHLDLIEQDKTLPPAVAQKVRQLFDKVVGKKENEKYALLIGVDQYKNKDLPSNDSASKGVNALKRILVEHGYKSDGTTVTLYDKEATRARILEEFDRLVEHSKEHPAFFFFAGLGTAVEDGQGKAILAADSYMEDEPANDISLFELAKRSQSAKNLTIVIDAGFHPRGDRYTNPHDKSSARKDWEQRNQEPEHINNGRLNLLIGNICILSGVKKWIKSEEVEEINDDALMEAPLYPASFEDGNGSQLSSGIAALLERNVLDPVEIIEELRKENILR